MSSSKQARGTLAADFMATYSSRPSVPGGIDSTCDDRAADAEVLEAIEQDPVQMARACATLVEGREGVEQPASVRRLLRSLERARLARYETAPPRGQSEGTGWRRGWYLTERGRVVSRFVGDVVSRSTRRTEPPEPCSAPLVVQGPPRGDR